MSTRHLVDPELLPALDAMPPMDLAVETLPARRAAMIEAMRAAPVPQVDGVERSEHRAPGPAGAPEVPVFVYAPAAAKRPLPALLHIHGGGYVLGTASMYDPRYALLAAEVGCLVASVDYRLAPETRFPGAVEDCYAALKWLRTNAAALGADPDRIAIAGESAGGGLAAGLGLLVRDRAEVRLALQVLHYPMIDDRTCVAADQNPVAGEFVWTRAANRFGWEALLGHAPGIDGVSPYAAAARATDLRGLPPTYLSTSTLDLFVDENLDYARRLMRAGVPTEMHVYPGAYHGFTMSATARVSRQYQRDYHQALARALHG
ncbi:MAG: alpha/beta hydrolase [Gammaproteobacteria bacterium]